MDKIRVSQRTVYTPKCVDNAKILTVSDVHYRNDKYLSRLKRLLELIKEIKPDIICIPGDFADTFDDVSQNKQKIMDVLYRFSQIAPTFYSFGSHDYYTFKGLDIETELKEWFNLLKSIDNNFHIFEPGNILEQAIQVPSHENLTISGYSIPINANHQIENNRELLPYFVSFVKELNLLPEDYNVALCHSPMSFFQRGKLIKPSEYGMENLNLVLSGHNHAGLLPKFMEPLNLGLGTPDKRPFARNVAGLHTNEEDFGVMISRGFLKFPGTLLGEFVPIGKFLYKFGNSKLFKTAECDLVVVDGKPKIKKFYPARNQQKTN